MLNVGAGEIALILIVALLVLGPKRLPELARGIGKFMREFRRQTDEVRTTIETEFYRMDQPIIPEDPAAQPIPHGDEQRVLPPPLTGPLDGGRHLHAPPVEPPPDAAALADEKPYPRDADHAPPPDADAEGHAAHADRSPAPGPAHGVEESSADPVPVAQPSALLQQAAEAAPASGPSASATSAADAPAPQMAAVDRPRDVEEPSR